MGAETSSSATGESASPQPGILPDAFQERATAAHDPGHDIVVIGASAGGVDVLKAIIAALPEHYPGAVFVVLHIPPSVPSVLPGILGRVARVRCVTAVDGAPIEQGTVYVAPPNHHLLLEPGHVRLVVGPRENGHRPSVDSLFRSAAAVYGARVVGVVLTGNLDDGTRGLLAIERAGGVAVVQDPNDADFPGMPESAIANVPVHHVLPATRIGPLLATLVPPPPTPPQRAEAPSMSSATPDVPPHVDGNGQNGGSPVPPAATAPALVPAVVERAVVERAVERAADLATGVGVVDGGARINEALGGAVSAFTCPECHGALWELRDGQLVRYRCRVGHSYTDQGLVDNKARAVEDALWTALTALEESAAIAARVADRATAQGRERSAVTFRERATFLEQRGTVLRDVLSELPGHVDGI